MLFEARRAAAIGRVDGHAVHEERHVDHRGLGDLAVEIHLRQHEVLHAARDVAPSADDGALGHGSMPIARAPEGHGAGRAMGAAPVG
ncbi:MAG: hypothetical protein RIF41_00145, partial [Polyangiaceae bacterium]